MRCSSRSARGQTTMEYMVLLIFVALPLTFGLIALCQMLWIWHSVADWTRDTAQYASTHCWYASGENVANWMREHTPMMFDQATFRNGGADLEIKYYYRNPDSGAIEDFSCDAECSTGCIPDLVSVRVRNYEFRSFLSYLGLPPVAMPDLGATTSMESAGCDPEQAVCLP